MLLKNTHDHKYVKVNRKTLEAGETIETSDLNESEIEKFKRQEFIVKVEEEPEYDEEGVEKLKEIKGIGEARAKEILDEWEGYKDFLNNATRKDLEKFGIQQEYITEITEEKTEEQEEE